MFGAAACVSDVDDDAELFVGLLLVNFSSPRLILASILAIYEVWMSLSVSSVFVSLLLGTIINSCTTSRVYAYRAFAQYNQRTKGYYCLLRPLLLVVLLLQKPWLSMVWRKEAHFFVSLGTFLRVSSVVSSNELLGSVHSYVGAQYRTL